MLPEIPTSPKREGEATSSEPPTKVPRGSSSTAREATASAEPSQPSIPAEVIPVPEVAENEFVIDDVYLVNSENMELPDGWRCVDGCMELDDVYMAALRKGEVNMKKLTPAQQAEFVEAKRGELENYFGNFVWEFATEEESSKAIKGKRVITARWVLTWKRTNENEPDAIPVYKAKARLVLRGFEDPDLGGMKTAAPTAHRTSRTFLCAVATWFGWVICCGDVKAAFLSGSGFDRTIIVRLPMDCNPILGVMTNEKGKHTYMKLKKSAYGLADAPLLWYEEAKKRLLAGGWKIHPLDQCCFLLSEWSKEKHREVLIGMLIIHVDDILMTGDEKSEKYKNARKHMKQNFNFGKWEELSEQNSLKYCGGQIMKNQHGIEISYAEYMSKVCPISLAKGRKPTDEMSASEKSKCRALVGALQWPSTQGMPVLSASTSLLAGEIANGSVQSVMELNKALRFGKSHADVNMKFLARPETKQVADLESMVLVCYADAAFCARKDKSSQGGFIIMACEKGVLNGKKRPGSTIAWRSFKLPRVCRSSLAAECQSMATALEELVMTKTFLEILKHPEKKLKDVMDKTTGECAMVTDCKALYDAIHRETIQQATDKRVAIEGLVIKDLLRDLRCQWRWVTSERQLADGLTKLSARNSFVERYKGHYVQLVADMDYTAAKKKTQEERQRT